MTYARVRDKKTGVVADKTVKSYTLIKHRYELIAYVDEQGNEVQGPESAPEPQKKSVSVAKPAAPKMSPEEIAAKREEMEQMNRDAIAQAQKEQAPSAPASEETPATEEVIAEQSEPAKPAPKKRGPKPKVKA